MKSLYSITEVADLFERTRQWAHQQYQEGKFPNAQVIGHQIAIPLSDIEALKQSKGA